MYSNRKHGTISCSLHYTFLAVGGYCLFAVRVKNHARTTWGILPLSSKSVSLRSFDNVFVTFEIQKDPSISFESPQDRLAHPYLQGRLFQYKIVEKMVTELFVFFENENFLRNKIIDKNSQK